jgi:MATE family multidrug resistance protein
MAAAKTDRAEPPTTACGAAGRECCLLTRLGVPSSIANFAMGTQLAIALIVAPLGEDAIAGAGIGVMWQNVTAVSVFVGIQYGFGALCAQAFGSKNYRRTGVLLQRTLLVQAVLCVPMAVLWYETEAILLALGQPATVSQYAGVFVRTQLIALPFQGLYQALATFLRSQMLVRLVMYLSVPTAVFMIVLAKVLVDENFVGLGFIGAPLALAIGGVVQSLLLLWLVPR